MIVPPVMGIGLNPEEWVEQCLSFLHRAGVEIEYEIHYNCGPQKVLRGSRGKKNACFERGPAGKARVTRGVGR